MSMKKKQKKRKKSWTEGYEEGKEEIQKVLKSLQEEFKSLQQGYDTLCKQEIKYQDEVKELKEKNKVLNLVVQQTLEENHNLNSLVGDECNGLNET